MPTVFFSFFFFFYNNSLWCSLLISVMLLKYKLLHQSLNPKHTQAWKQPPRCLASFFGAPFPRKVGWKDSLELVPRILRPLCHSLVSETRPDLMVPCPLPGMSSWAGLATPINQEKIPPSPVLSSHHDLGSHAQGPPGGPDEAIPARLQGSLLYRSEQLMMSGMGEGQGRKFAGLGAVAVWSSPSSHHESLPTPLLAPPSSS